MLRAEGVSKQFERTMRDSNVFDAVKQLDFELPQGLMVEICGRSGSGKSTLLNMLAGLLSPTTGRVLLDDVDMYSLDDAELSRLRNAKIGVVPQVHSALGSLTVLENVCLPLSLYGDQDTENRAEQLLDMLGIGDLADVMPAELSGGELRRVAIARALIRKPSILLADEPTGDLDDENTEIVLQHLQDSAREGVSVLLVTHETTAANYADRVYRMEKGELLEV